MSDIASSDSVGKRVNVLLPGPWTLTRGWTWAITEAVMSGDPVDRIGDIVAVHHPDWKPGISVVLSDAALDEIIYYLNHKYIVVGRSRDGKVLSLVDIATTTLSPRGLTGAFESQMLDLKLKDFIATSKKNDKTGADIIITVVQEWIAARLGQAMVLLPTDADYRPDMPWPFCTDPITGRILFNGFMPPVWFIQAQRAIEAGALPDKTREAEEIVAKFHAAFFRTDAEERYWTRLLGFKYLTPAAELPLCIFEAVRDDGSQIFGVGRGTYFSVMGHMAFGSSNSTSVSIRQLGSNFNTFEGHVFVEVPELPHKTGSGRAKGMHDITADRLRQTIDPSLGRFVGREAKGRDVAAALRCKLMAACTNYETALEIEDGDRRIWIARCAHKVDDAARAAMEKIRQDNDTALLAALVRWYQERAFTSVDDALAPPPMTAAKREAVLLGIADWEDIYLDALSDREALPYPIVAWPQVELAMRLNASAQDKRHVASPDGVRANDRADTLTLSREALDRAKARFFKTAPLPTGKGFEDRHAAAQTLRMRDACRLISPQVPVPGRNTAYVNPVASPEEQEEALRLLAAPASEERNPKIRTPERLKVVDMLAGNDAALERKRHAVLKWLDAGCPPESHLKLVPKTE